MILQGRSSASLNDGWPKVAVERLKVKSAPATVWNERSVQCVKEDVPNLAVISDESAVGCRADSVNVAVAAINVVHTAATHAAPNRCETARTCAERHLISRTRIHAAGPVVHIGPGMQAGRTTEFGWKACVVVGATLDCR